jgi:hypothetical protein
MRVPNPDRMLIIKQVGTHVPLVMQVLHVLQGFPLVN